MVGLMNMYLSWPIFVVIVVAGVGLGVFLGMLFKTHKVNNARLNSYSNKGNNAGSMGGIAGSGSVTSDYEYSNETAHQDMQKKIELLEIENAQLKRTVVELTDDIEREKVKIKTIETKLEKIAKELEKDEHPVYNQILRLLKTLTQCKFNSMSNMSTQTMSASADDALIESAVASGSIIHDERWYDMNGQEIANNRLDLINYLNNNNIHQLGRIRTK